MDDVAGRWCACLRFLDWESRGTPITVFLDSPGGLLHAGMAIMDTIGELRSPVHTHALHSAECMALLLLASGAKGHRRACRAARFSLSELYAAGQVVDQGELERSSEVFAQAISGCAGRDPQHFRKLMSGGRALSPSDALANGLIDEIVD